MKRLLMIACLLSTSVHAAEIKYVPGVVNVIDVSGEIVEGDSQTFDSVIEGIPPNTKIAVMLNSNGGKVIPGLMMGEAIRAKGFATVVLGTCASAWWPRSGFLAGEPRFAGESARIGFHAAYTPSGGESGMTNALVGAYLTKLGLPYEAVAFVTSSAPVDMRWMHADDARKIGIAVVTLPSNSTTESTQEQQAKNLVTSYFTAWSASDDLSRFYADPVLFYGTAISRAKVMDIKHKFSARWPVRHYMVRNSSMVAECSDACVVNGVVEWDVNSAERGAHSNGSAKFILTIAKSLIVAENGSVIENHTDSVPGAAIATAQPPATTAGETKSVSSSDQQMAMTTQAYAEGRQARLQYEGWFTSLPEGSYRNGAEYWINNRSSKTTPPTCSNETDQNWQFGCVTARKILAPIDFRRRTEKNYWFGWNSL